MQQTSTEKVKCLQLNGLDLMQCLPFAMPILQKKNTQKTQ